MNDSFNKYIITNILLELDIIGLRIETLPDSTKKKAAQLVLGELRKLIKAIEEEETRND